MSRDTLTCPGTQGPCIGPWHDRTVLGVSSLFVHRDGEEDDRTCHRHGKEPPHSVTRPLPQPLLAKLPI
eukprot:639153-Hanusia_phi.AAC.1